MTSVGLPRADVRFAQAHSVAKGSHPEMLGASRFGPLHLREPTWQRTCADFAFGANPGHYAGHLPAVLLTSPSIAPSQKKISWPWLKVENSELAMLIAHQPISAAAPSARQGCGDRQRNVQ